ncbi:hypothetical protein AB6H26_01270 [Providencia hangzhouensis]|uniref:hypothetical protein n=1 Tax=Providencia hangzhouensis TaxID=3031799 RepID=UPI0034DD9A42
MKQKAPPPHIKEYRGFKIVRGYRSAVNPQPLYYIKYHDCYDELSLGGFYSILSAKDYIDNLI